MTNASGIELLVVMQHQNSGYDEAVLFRPCHYFTFVKHISLDCSGEQL